MIIICRELSAGARAAPRAPRRCRGGPPPSTATDKNDNSNNINNKEKSYY